MDIQNLVMAVAIAKKSGGGGGGVSVSTITVTLTSAGWSDDAQTVTATGVTATNAVIVAPVPSDMEDYVSAGIYASAQGVDSLTFTKTGAVSGDIDVNVMIVNEGGLA